jgi:site-specific DNA-methyltransferase (adenine-specific)
VKPYYEHAGITIYHGDCRDILPTLGTVDAILTDPPYGIGASSGIGKYGRLRANNEPKWDTVAPDLTHIPPVQSIVWGGNYFGLTPSRMYVIWDKGAGFAGRDFAECEQAWCSWDGNAKIYRRDPLACRDYVGKEHPTEKPIPLFRWCLNLFPNTWESLVDPYCGSGTALIAAKSINRRAIGIEIEERYCEIAAKRLSQEVMDFGGAA